MSLVHCGIDTGVAVLLLGAEVLGLGTEDVVGETDAVGGAVVTDEEGEVLGEVGVVELPEVLWAPKPEVELLHPASAATAMNMYPVSCACLRIIGLSPCW
jgi:hypothetical protein